jgi:DNA-binding NtrC family response regulator
MKKPKPVRRAKAASATSPRGVFVVDDNVALSKLAALVLESAGYKVRHFSDPKAVLKAIHEANPKPCLLVTDYEMDGMNGVELIRSSHKVHPDLKTLLVSGSVDASIMILHPGEVHRFLGKPYEPAQLRNIVAELLTT